MAIATLAFVSVCAFRADGPILARSITTAILAGLALALVWVEWRMRHGIEFDYSSFEPKVAESADEALKASPQTGQD